MKAQRFLIIFTVINTVILIVNFSDAGMATAQEENSILRGNGFELVDKAGIVRARFDIYDDGNAVFRLIDKNGIIRVKLGASEKGSGLLLANDATEPGVHILASDTGSSIKIKNKDGSEKFIEP